MTATISIENEIAIITMNDGKANAISPTMLDSLHAALDQAEKEAKAVILVGMPGKFSAGFDLKIMQGATPDEVTSLVKAGGRLALRLYTFPTPVIAACSGHAIAMGCFILCGCDHRIGIEGPFKIGANETQIGLNMPLFGTEFPKARLDTRRLTEAIIDATLYDPADAVEVGFLDEVVAPENLMDAALAKAEQLKPLTGPVYLRTKLQIRQATIDIITPTVQP